MSNLTDVNRHDIPFGYRSMSIESASEDTQCQRAPGPMMSIDVRADEIQMTQDVSMSFHASAALASADRPVLQRQMTPAHRLRYLPRTL